MQLVLASILVLLSRIRKLFVHGKWYTPSLQHFRSQLLHIVQLLSITISHALLFSVILCYSLIKSITNLSFHSVSSFTEIKVPRLGPQANSLTKINERNTTAHNHTGDHCQNNKRLGVSHSIQPWRASKGKNTSKHVVDHRHSGHHFNDHLRVCIH